MKIAARFSIAQATADPNENPRATSTLPDPIPGLFSVFSAFALCVLVAPSDGWVGKTSVWIFDGQKRSAVK